ncbi:hypothetical protein HELRODRAFT_165453 [Helobdella robusta]|uniref:Uncharacterized protein n=1 Tax=Helobdella robusta TaxID=6412 RepID=T1EWT9_HELRO|nr:hypothetical protein HELRODRAFT_165453 [Helobdella robusta]ESN91421.1 hypothetical protein HELRODRAFT_165453 [Helobdella robusta]
MTNPLELKMSQVIKSEIIKYGENSSVRGISKYFKSNDLFLRFLWLVLLVGSTTYMIYSLCILLNDYYTYPVTTEYGEKIGQNILFPDITICNLDPFNAGESEEFSLNEYLIKLKTVKNRFLEIVGNDPPFNESWSMKIVNNAFNEMASVSGYIMNLNKNRPELIDCPNFIVDCKFFGSNWFEMKDACSVDNFTRRWNANYYTCYTLKTGALKKSYSKSIRGLDLLLNVGPVNLMKIPYKSSFTSSQSRGVQVSVHSPGTSPDLKRGFNVAPGTENVVEIIQTERKRLKVPYNKLDCTDEKMLSNSSETYTHDLCTEYCQQDNMKNLCDCNTHLLSVPDKEMDDIPLCGNFTYFLHSQNNESTLDDLIADSVICLCNSFTWTLSDFAETNEKSCVKKCLIPCEETMYQFYLTSVAWPQPSVQLDLFEKYFIKRGCINHQRVKTRFINYFNYYNQFFNSSYVNTSFSNFTQISESLLEIKFLIKQNFPYFQMDKPVYTSDMMVGTVGGMLSLWLGITVASAVEIVELVYLLLKRCWERYLNAKLNGNEEYKNDFNYDQVLKNENSPHNTLSTKL